MSGGTVVENDIDLYGRVAAGVEDLAREEGSDRRHRRPILERGRGPGVMIRRTIARSSGRATSGPERTDATRAPPRPTSPIRSPARHDFSHGGSRRHRASEPSPAGDRGRSTTEQKETEADASVSLELSV